MDGWSIAHFIGFFMLGVYFPNRLHLVIIGTIIFEIFEKIMSEKTPFLKESLKDTMTDIVINIVGYLIGQKI